MIAWFLYEELHVVDYEKLIAYVLTTRTTMQNKDIARANTAYASSIAQSSNHHGAFVTDNVITNLFKPRSSDQELIS